MKKLSTVLIGALMALFLCLSSYAFEPPDSAKYSAVYTADAQAIHTGAGYFYGLAVMTDGTNACTIVTYDNTANSGTNKLHPDWVVTTSATERAKVYHPAAPIQFNTGISADITCAGTCSFQYLYRAK